MPAGSKLNTVNGHRKVMMTVAGTGCLLFQAHDIRDYVGAFVGLEHKVRHENVVLPQEAAQPAG